MDCHVALENSLGCVIHGCVIGSPISPVVANLCMEVIENSAQINSMVTPKVWKRYVDDSFVIIKRDAISAFHDTLNSIDPKISFTIETESNGQIAFLDTLVSRNNGKITIEVYRKPTHPDRYLDFNSHHQKKHKISTAPTLLKRACNLPSTADGKSKQVKHVSDALKANGYPQSIISNILKKKRATETIPSPEELIGTFLSGLRHQKQVLTWLVRLISMASPNHFKDYFETMEPELSPDPTEPYIRNSLRQNSGHSATFKQMRSTRFPAMTAVVATLEKPADVYTREERNSSEMLNNVTKDGTSQTLHG